MADFWSSLDEGAQWALIGTLPLGVLAALIVLGLVMQIVVWLRRVGRKPVSLRQAAPEGRLIALDNGLTHVIERGAQDDPPLVLVHGLTTPSFVFDGIAPALVSRGFRVISYDHYGRGLSDRPGGLQDGAFYRGHLNALLKSLGVTGPIDLIGYSMGGAIVTDFAATHPDKVKSVTLIAPAGMTTNLGGLVRRAALWPILGDWLMELAYPRLHRRGCEAERVLPNAVPNLIDRQIAELRFRGFVRSVLSSLRGILKHRQEPEHRRLAKLNLPISAIWGAEDAVIPLTSSDALRMWNPDARQVVIEGAGHGLAYTHAAKVIEAIEIRGASVQ